jgi:amino acid permease
MNRYHTSNVIRIIFIILNLLNIYFALVSQQIYLNQIIDIIVISFLIWSLYDNPNFFKRLKKNDRKKERRKMRKLKREIEKNQLYKDQIEMNDF